MAKNVFGEELMTCSQDPLTGYYRDGCCKTDASDLGVHTVCAVMTKEFLAFSAAKGNDLSTPRPEFDFPGLVEGDQWCLCAPRWAEAYREGKAPKVILSATHEGTLEYVSLDVLIECSI